MNYVGIDHHRQYSHMTMMDQEGQVLRTGRVPNLRSEIEKFLEGGEERGEEYIEAQNISRAARKCGRVGREPPSVPDEAEIARTSPSGIREGYEKCSTETSAAIKSSCEAA